MQVKATFIMETESSSPIDAIEEWIYNIFVNGETIRDYAFLYTKGEKESEWSEVE